MDHATAVRSLPAFGLMVLIAASCSQVAPTPASPLSTPAQTRVAHTPTAAFVEPPTTTSASAQGHGATPTATILDPCETTSAKELNQFAILFTADWSGTPDIYMGDAAGTRHVLVVGGPDHELQPAWFSAGNAVSYLVGRPGTLFSLYTVPSGGGTSLAFPGTEASIGQVTVDSLSGASLLITPDQDSYYLWYVWSPDSTAVAYRGPDGTLNHIYVASLIRKRLDMTPDGLSQTGDISWSWDGALLAFEEFTAPAISTVRVIESPALVTTLTEEFARVSGPRWSPVGSDLVFIGDVPFPYTQPSKPQLFLANVPGVSAVPIATSSAPVERAWWSPDATRIAFTGFELDSDGRFTSKGIGVVTLGDGSIHQLARDIGIDMASVSWSPDARYITYTSTHAAGTDLYVVSVCSGESRLIVENVLPGPAPWRPSDGMAGTLLATEP
jgi:Tol biopolymer transport system component